MDRWLHKIALRFRSLFRSTRVEAKLDEELRFHLERHVEDPLARGLTLEEARRAAAPALGGLEQPKEACRDTRRTAWIDNTARDFRYALRVLLKAPVFAITAILTLGLCIGPNAAIYTVVDQLLLRPLRYPQPERLAVVATHFERQGRSSDNFGQTGSTYLRLREAGTAVDVASVGGTMGVNLVAQDRPEYVRQRRVSAGFFRVLGAPPVIGREFSADEDTVNGAAAVILSYGLWLRAFGGDPNVIGRTTTLRGEPHRIVGVLPGEFAFGEPVDLWTPLRPSPRGEGGGQNYEIIARLAPSTTWPEADAQVASLGAPVIRDLYRNSTAEVRLSLVPLQRGLTDELRLPLLILLGAVGIVLVIGCVNIAGLLLARGVARTPEIATRMAIGGGRAAIVRQLLAETIVLGACGGLVGVVIGYGILQILAFELGDVFGAQPFVIDARVLAITGAVSLCTSALFGLFPAFQASRVDPRAAMIESSGAAVAGTSGRWPRRVLVVSEISLGVTLLVGAGLLVRTLDRLTRLNPGFDGTHVLTASLSLQDARYETSDRTVRLFNQTLERIRAIPGVQSAAVCLTLPYERALNMPWRFVGRSPPNEIINVTYTSSGYFETLRVPVLRGRTFTDVDYNSAAPVIVVNQEFVRKHSPDDDPIGRQITTGGSTRTVIGIVGDIQQKAAFGNYGPVAATPAAYIPAAQVSSDSFKLWHTWFSPSWIVRTAGEPTRVAADMQRAVQSVDPHLPFAKFRTVGDVRSEAVAQQRAETILLGSLAGLAVLLAAIGIYGLVANSVSERTRELGIRLALGATSSQATMAAALPGLVLGIIGVSVGLVVARVGATTMRSLIWGITTSDPLTFILAAAVVVVVVVIATFIPALRIVRLNPMKALRTW